MAALGYQPRKEGNVRPPHGCGSSEVPDHIHMTTNDPVIEASKERQDDMAELYIEPEVSDYDLTKGVDMFDYSNLYPKFMKAHPNWLRNDEPMLKIMDATIRTSNRKIKHLETFTHKQNKIIRGYFLFTVCLISVILVKRSK